MPCGPIIYMNSAGPLRGRVARSEIALTTPENRILEANVVNLTHEGRYRGLILVFHDYQLNTTGKYPARICGQC